jgi:pantoate--beta-alanine ligase
VLTVVAKLLGLVRPDVAVFGEKDFQQLVLIEQMSRDLCLGVDIVGAETVREADGLALSSRNRYLSAEERARAAVLNRALRAAQERASYGAAAARWAAMSVLDEVPESELDLDYLAIRTPVLTEVADPHPSVATPARILVAARVGATRLIDNLPLTLGPTR